MLYQPVASPSTHTHVWHPLPRTSNRLPFHIDQTGPAPPPENRLRHIRQRLCEYIRSLQISPESTPRHRSARSAGAQHTRSGHVRRSHSTSPTRSSFLLHSLSAMQHNASDPTAASFFFIRACITLDLPSPAQKPKELPFFHPE